VPRTRRGRAAQVRAPMMRVAGFELVKRSTYRDDRVRV